MHGAAQDLHKLLSSTNRFLRWLKTSAEQLEWSERWRILLSRIFIWFLRGRLLTAPKLIGNMT
jgi:hypothetical protein